MVSQLHFVVRVRRQLRAQCCGADCNVASGLQGCRSPMHPALPTTCPQMLPLPLPLPLALPLPSTTPPCLFMANNPSMIQAAPPCCRPNSSQQGSLGLWSVPRLAQPVGAREVLVGSCYWTALMPASTAGRPHLTLDFREHILGMDRWANLLEGCQLAARGVPQQAVSQLPCIGQIVGRHQEGKALHSMQSDTGLGNLHMLRRCWT